MLTLPAMRNIGPLRNLPRDSRDTLFLLVVTAWVLLPQIGNEIGRAHV